MNEYNYQSGAAMGRGRSDRKIKQINQALVGWLVFVVCALFFIASSLRNRDVLTLIGGVLFLIGCILFIVPLVSEKRNANLDVCSKEKKGE